jgi:hypothetical protein
MHANELQSPKYGAEQVDWWDSKHQIEQQCSHKRVSGTPIPSQQHTSNFETTVHIHNLN